MKKLAYLILLLACALRPLAAHAQATLLPLGEQCFSATMATSGGSGGTGTGFIGLLGTITGGTGGTTGTYGGVALTGGSGTNATANITVSGGAVTAVAIVNPGVGYVVGDTLSAVSANIGGVTGFSVPVSSVSINQSLAGGSVAYYVPNTLTPKQTWQNSAQTILNSNPVALDGNGCAIVYGSGIYRQILKDSLGNTVWDQLTASTNSTNSFWANQAGGTANAITVTDASFSGVDGSIIGFIPLSTNTGAATLTPSGTGTPVTIVKDTAVGAVALTGGEIVANSPSNIVEVQYSATQNTFHILNLIQQTSAPVPPPQGYLNLQGNAGGGPIQGFSDITGATTAYYTPYNGNQIPIWNGSTFTITAFSELDLALSASRQSGNTIYDACVFNNSGTPTIVFGPAWTNSTAGNGSRGTGAGSAQLVQQNGIWVNAFSISANNGSSSYTVPQFECTYVGSVFVDSTAGQVSTYRTIGASRKWGVWNAYNRVPIILQVTDGTSQWSYGTATWRPSNNNTADSFTLFSGLPQEQAIIRFQQVVVFGNATGTEYEPQIGIGYNSTSSPLGFQGQSSGPVANGSFLVGNTIQAELDIAPFLGIETITSLEQAVSGHTVNFFGNNGNMLLNGQWRG